MKKYIDTIILNTALTIGVFISMIIGMFSSYIIGVFVRSINIIYFIYIACFGTIIGTIIVLNIKLYKRRKEENLSKISYVLYTLLPYIFGYFLLQNIDYY